MAEWRPDFDDLPAGDGVLVLSPQLAVLSATLQAERLLRRRLEPGQVLPLAEIFLEPHLSQVAEALQETWQTGASRSHLLVQIRRGTDAPIFLKCSLSPLYSPEAEISGAVLAFHDDALTVAWSAWSNIGMGVEPEAVFENLDRGVFIVDQRWRIRAFNKRAQEITGFQREEAVGRLCWEVFQADRCQRGCFLRATVEDGAGRTDQTVRITNKAGERLDLLVSTAPIRNKREVIVGGVETFQSLGVALAKGQAGASSREVEIIGRSPAMKRLLNMLPQVAASEAAVVLEGESGTGKDLLARALHLQSPRAKGPFVAFSCSALVETLMESELFGHVKGAFTGAIRDKVGRFEMAQGGTLFLDEIGELKPELQAKLLRVLETRVFERVGGTRPIPLEARVIAATSRNLSEEVRRGRFRLDLLYRLRTVSFNLPPLRERREDIPLLVNHCLGLLNRKYGKNIRGVDPKVITLFQHYSWPGNIRELERVLEHAFVFVQGAVITKEYLPELESPLPRSGLSGAPSYQSQSLSEQLTIQKALQKVQGNREAAARLLGISRSSLWRKMKAYGLL
ncbi:MAG: sigma 54-interacting transcriptional regulator [Thermodesulfobacteriota bacterium]